MSVNLQCSAGFHAVRAARRTTMICEILCVCEMHFVENRNKNCYLGLNGFSFSLSAFETIYSDEKCLCVIVNLRKKRKLNEKKQSFNESRKEGNARVCVECEMKKKRNKTKNS